MTVSLLRDVTTTISCVLKMAESLREVERNRDKNLRLMSENGEFLSAKSDKKIEDSSVDNLKSLFYLNNVQNNCFSKYSVNSDGVNRASEFCPDVDGFSSEYKGICANNEENCRKKRCSDRYDSSESCDSGIAVSSSASSGTSDITDPGSPFSTSSEDSSTSPGKCKVGKRCKSEEKSLSRTEPSGRCRSEEKTWTGAWERKQQSDKTDHNFITPETDFKMAPNAPSASTPCDIWTSITENNTASDTAPFNQYGNKTQSEAISNKRLKVDAKESNAPLNINNNIVVNVPSPISSEIETDVEESKKRSSSDNCVGAKMKTRRASADSAKVSSKETSAEVASSKTNKNGTKAGEKAAGAAGKSKTNDRGRHQGKITEYFKSQIKSLAGSKRDLGQKKEGVAASKGKPNNKSESSEPPAKKQKMTAEEKAKNDANVFVKPSPKPPPKPLETSTFTTRLRSFPKLSKAAEFVLSKPVETKTLFNKILQNHKNRKLAESNLKNRSSLKPKSTTDVESTTSSSSAQSSMPPPSMPPPSSSLWSSTSTSTSTSTSSQKPYETSTMDNNLMETVSGEAEGSSSNLEDKVQNKDLDSNSLNIVVSNEPEVKGSEVISGPTDAVVESDLSKSPILTAPTTIRFPVVGQNNRVDKNTPTKENSSCRWDACSVQADSAGGLLEHLQTAHVLTQVTGEKYVCLWVGCKVYDQKSCSRSWLERHVLSHAGNKPYRCIVDGCGQGFSTQAILERHVNNHFSGDVKKALDNNIAHKLFRRNGKKLRYRRQPWSARMFDFFDSGVMDGLRHRLLKFTKIQTGGDIENVPGKCLALTSQVVARRVSEDGNQQFLLRWSPLNIVEDEWVNEKDIVRKKTVSIPSLSPAVASYIYDNEDFALKSCSYTRLDRRKNKGYQMRGPVVPPIDYTEPSKRREETSPPTPTKVVDDLSSKTSDVVEQSQPSSTPTPTPTPTQSPSPAPAPSPQLLPPPPPPPPPKKVSNRRKAKTKGKKKDDANENSSANQKKANANENCCAAQDKADANEGCCADQKNVDANENCCADQKQDEANENCCADQKTLPAVSVPNVDIMKNGVLATEKTVSLRPKEGKKTAPTVPEEMSVVPVHPSAEEPVPVQTGGILVDNTKYMSSVKTEVVVNSPYKLVASQYIEQPFVQAVMPVQMPVTYHVPVVKFSQSCGMIFPQMSNYFIPSSTPMFQPSTIPAFRNGFQFSTTGTIQIQTSSTTLQHTASSFMQSTNTSGFQIVQQSPAANFQQSVFASYQNSQILSNPSMNIRSPTLRLVNYQPLIINQAKPVGNVSMTLANVPSIAGPNPSTVTVTTMPLESTESGTSVIAPGEFVNSGVATMTMAAPVQQQPQLAPLPSPPSPPPLPPPQATGSSPTGTTPPKKMVKGNLKILPRPEIMRGNGIVEGTKNKKQCLQSCGPSIGKTT